MAQVIKLVDDIDGSAADESVTVSVGDQTWVLDLTTAHADELRLTFQGWTQHGREVTVKRSTTTGSSNLSEIREWARSNNMAVPDRGRIPAVVLQAWENRNDVRSDDNPFE